MEWLSQIKPPFGIPLSRSHWASQGLVAQYTVNEMCGDLVHDSCGMNDGKMINMAPMSGTSGWVPGPHGGALAFDGSNDYVFISHNSALNMGTGDMSWVILAKRLADAWATVIAKTGTGILPPMYELKWSSSGNLYLNWTDTLNDFAQLSDVSQFPDYNWHFVAVVLKQGIGVYFYGDGLSNFKSQAGTINCTNTQRVVIGRRENNSQLLTGLISSVSIYNRALSDEEIAYLYAFPWCMFDRAIPAWMMNQQNRNFDHYYRRLMAA
jgi:hypothetical protein